MKVTSHIRFVDEVISIQELVSFTISLLVIPGSEAICMRCFSQLKLIQNQSRLKDDILDSMLRLKLNHMRSKEINVYEGEDIEDEEQSKEEEK